MHPRRRCEGPRPGLVGADQVPPNGVSSVRAREDAVALVARDEVALRCQVSADDVAVVQAVDVHARAPVAQGGCSGRVGAYEVAFYAVVVRTVRARQEDPAPVEAVDDEAADRYVADPLYDQSIGVVTGRAAVELDLGYRVDGPRRSGVLPGPGLRVAVDDHRLRYRRQLEGRLDGLHPGPVPEDVEVDLVGHGRVVDGVRLLYGRVGYALVAGRSGIYVAGVIT